ncbi:MAG: NifU family protein [Alphaproteobacteria bacterium]|nr:NifU family protein [Alphaproteobacteria bacterium]
MFIQTESTPNPQTLKFLPGRDVLGVGGREFANEEAAAASPLAAAVFAVEGVRRVYLGPDFITATKDDALAWEHLKPHVLAAIMEHYVAGRPTLLDDATAESEDGDGRVYEGEAAEIVAQLKDLIETRIRPAVARDGGDVLFHSWDHEDGVVRLTMRGACAGCPSSAMTLKQGIENMLRHYVPEVVAVEQADA